MSKRCKNDAGSDMAPEIPSSLFSVLYFVGKMWQEEHAEAVSAFGDYVANLSSYAGQIRKADLERAIDTKVRAYRGEAKGASPDRTRWLQNKYTRTGLREGFIQVAEGFSRLQVPPSQDFCNLLSLMDEPRERNVGRHHELDSGRSAVEMAPQVPRVIRTLLTHDASPADHAGLKSELATYQAKLFSFVGQKTFASRTRSRQNEIYRTGLREYIRCVAYAYYRLQIPLSADFCCLLLLLNPPRERNASARLAVRREQALFVAGQASKQGKSLGSHALARLTTLSRETLRRWLADPAWEEEVRGIASAPDEPPRIYAGPIHIIDQPPRKPRDVAPDSAE